LTCQATEFAQISLAVNKIEGIDDPASGLNVEDQSTAAADAPDQTGGAS
jgi:hypothetical protein